jgi:hypothetical protein
MTYVRLKAGALHQRLDMVTPSAAPRVFHQHAILQAGKANRLMVERWAGMEHV